MGNPARISNMSRRDGAYFPDAAKKFVLKLNDALQTKDLYEVESMYDVEFRLLTERLYKASRWPAAEVVAPLVDNDENFLVLYKQLYYRHIYAKLDVEVRDHFASFRNYIELFNIVLGLTTEQPEFEVNSEWLWDMIDEFIYQFQAFHAYRHNLSALSIDAKKKLQSHPHVWAAFTVVRYLLALAQKGGLQTDLRICQVDEEKRKINDASVHKMFKSLSQFSLIGICRINCLLGDYHGAIESLNQIDLSKRINVFHNVVASATSLYYYLSFSYLMSARYADAVSTLVEGILYISRNKHTIPRTYQQQAINKKTEQMYGLLAMALALAPQRVDETAAAPARDKVGENNVERLAAMDQNAFKDVFMQSCPKFVTMHVPDFNDEMDTHDEAIKMQLCVFLSEIKKRKQVPEIYSYLKMCTAITQKKLAGFLGESIESVVHSLLYLKSKTRGLRWKKGLITFGATFVQLMAWQPLLMTDSVYLYAYIPSLTILIHEARLSN